MKRIPYRGGVLTFPLPKLDDRDRCSWSVWDGEEWYSQIHYVDEAASLDRRVEEFKKWVDHILEGKDD